MQFGEKLRLLRSRKGWSQSKAAEAIGVSLRTFQNYESCRMYPKQTAVYGRIAELFHVSADYLLTDEENKSVEEPADTGVHSLLYQANALFAGGALSDEDKEKVIRTLNDLYWKAKDNSRKKEKSK